jgi:hypothetical protein
MLQKAQESCLQHYRNGALVKTLQGKLLGYLWDDLIYVYEHEGNRFETSPVTFWLCYKSEQTDTVEVDFANWNNLRNIENAIATINMSGTVERRIRFDDGNRGTTYRLVVPKQIELFPKNEQAAKVFDAEFSVDVGAYLEDQDGVDGGSKYRDSWGKEDTMSNAANGNNGANGSNGGNGSFRTTATNGDRGDRIID